MNLGIPLGHGGAFCARCGLFAVSRHAFWNLAERGLSPVRKLKSLPQLI